MVASGLGLECAGLINKMATKDVELPSDLVESMSSLQRSLDDCDEILRNLTKTPLHDMKNKLEPIEKARLDLTTSYTINSLFWVYLVTQGVNATDHPVKGELDRIKAYMSKIKDTEEKVKGAPMKVDKDAAKRFIKSALWNNKDERNDNDNAKKEDSHQQVESLPTKRDSLAKRKESESHHKKRKKKKVKQD